MNQNIIIFVACICFIFLIGRIFIVPIKTVIKLIINSLLGGALIYIINIIGNIYEFHLGLNIATSICVGLLGIPGAILLVTLKILFGWSLWIVQNLQFLHFCSNIVLLEKEVDYTCVV